jgi:cytochrome c5
MKLRITVCVLMFCAFSLLNLAAAKTGTSKDDSNAPAVSSHTTENDKAMRLEGEKRFHSNCSRCHAAPPKFPPRMMGTIVRHMRVRAMLTDQDMRLILRYMTE